MPAAGSSKVEVSQCRWQPMAAGRVRALAKTLVDKEEIQARANKAIEEVAARKRLWEDEYNNEEPQPMGKAA